MGKYAFIGIYNSDMLVPIIPYTLPQLFFVVRFRTPIDNRPKKFKVRIERPGHPPFELDNTNLLSSPSSPPSKEARFWQVQSIVRIAPFEITEIGTVKVFVEDEHGDNYAGGLRLKVGVHPEASMPQVALTANLVSAQFRRLENSPKRDREKLALQLLAAMSSFIKHSGADLPLQFPDADVRILLDDKRVHVFFPELLEGVPQVAIDSGGNFDEATVETVDQFGFIAKFAPSAPVDLVFNYTVELQLSEKPQKKK